MALIHQFAVRVYQVYTRAYVPVEFPLKKGRYASDRRFGLSGANGWCRG